MKYQSNITCRDLAPAFRHTFVDTGAVGHDVMHDEDFDRACGYISHDEAAILAAIASAVGGDWLEIGSHTGWSASHIALGADSVVCVDPEFARPDFRGRAWGNMQRAGIAGKIELRILGGFADEKFTGAFIDGNHSPPEPLNDAKMVYDSLRERAAVVFHDFIGWPVHDGVRWLIDQGMKFRIYSTQQMMAVCWRGDIEIPVHVPDPAIDWDGIRRRTRFDFKGES